MFSSGNISVRLRCADASAAITYTLNGSEPCGLSPVYTTGTTLTFSGTTVLKARAFRTGYMASGVTTRNYIHAPSIFAQAWPSQYGRPLGTPVNNPQVWSACATSAPARAGAPPPCGILSQLTAIPSMFLTWTAGTPVYIDGDKQEIPGSVEYWDPADPANTCTAEIAAIQDAGNRSNGRTPPEYFPGNKYSWHLIFKKAFTSHSTSRFAGPVIPSGQPNAGTSAIFPGSKVTSFHRLLLRNPGSDGWASGGVSDDRAASHYFNDAYLKETQRALSGSTALVPRRRWCTFMSTATTSAFTTSRSTSTRT